MLRKLLPLLLFIFIVSCQSVDRRSGTDKNTAVVTGYATIFDNDRALARDRATDDAKNKLVKKILGQNIHGKSLMEDYQIVYSIVEARSYGLVRDVKILEQGVRDGEYMVKLLGRVEPAVIRKAIDDALERYGRPKIIVLMDEVINGKKSRPGSTVTEALVQNIMVQQGFEFVDSVSVKKLARRNRNVINSARNGQAGKRVVKILMENRGAEMVLTGMVTVTDQTASLKRFDKKTRMVSRRANVTLKAIDLHTGRVLAVDTSTASGLHIDPLTAAKTAIKRALSLLMYVNGNDNEPGPFVKMITRKFVQGATNRQIQLIITGISYDKQRILRDRMLRRVRGVNKVYLRGQQGTAALMDVYFSGKTADFLDELQAKAGNFGFSVRVTESYPNRASLVVTAINE